MINLIDLKNQIEEEIKKYGEYKPVKIYDFKGKEVYNPVLSVFRNDSGEWIEIVEKV